MIKQVDLEIFQELFAVGLRFTTSTEAHRELLAQGLESYYRLRRTLEMAEGAGEPIMTLSALAPAAVAETEPAPTEVQPAEATVTVPDAAPAPAEAAPPPPKPFSGFGARRKREIFDRLKASRAAHESTINELAALAELPESDIIRACSAERLPMAAWEKLAAALDIIEHRKETRDADGAEA